MDNESQISGRGYGSRSFLEYLIKTIVDHPEEVTISEVDGEKTIVYELRVNRRDMGKVIGKKGQNARAIRTLLAAVSAKAQKRAVLEILE
ncbi:MAG TPA: KH domain-containing protein [Bacteroidetes bacterium]|nr:KH domain-containing protein [Bacteroidota bacterium]